MSWSGTSAELDESIAPGHDFRDRVVLGSRVESIVVLWLNLGVRVVEETSEIGGGVGPLKMSNDFDSVNLREKRVSQAQRERSMYEPRP